MDLISRLEMFWLQELQQGIRPSLILYSSDQILEDYLSTGAEPRVKGQNIVKKCLFESLRYKSLNCKPSLQTITAALEILASELSLVLYKPDEESSNSLTICGEVFVLDIHIESDGSISTVKLAASELNEIPDEAHEYLTKLAKDLDLFAFEKELAMFSFLDKTNGHHPQLNLFNCILGLQRDIAKIYELECRSESPKSVLLYGHGETKFYERNFGASITYHATQSMDDYDLPSLYFANISVEKSTLNHFLPKTIQQSCFDSSVGILPTEEQFYSKSTIEVLNGQIEVLSPNSNSSLSFNAAFVMELEPAVSLSLEMAKAIIGISGVSVTDQNLTNWTGPTFEEEYV